MSERKRILIIGGNGFVGVNLAKDLSRVHAVTCTHGSNFTRLPGVDYILYRALTDKDQGRKLIQATNPEIVIYAVGSNEINIAEHDVRMAQHHHTAGAAQLQSASEFAKAKFIYLSSDTVFSGHGGNHSEHDTTIPSTSLGKAKLGAENHIRSRSLNHVIIRSAPLLGRGTLEHPSWIDRLRESELLKKKFVVSDRMVRNPVHVSLLSDLILKCIETDFRNHTIHLGGITKISERKLAEKVLQALKLSTESLHSASANSSQSDPADYSLNFTQAIQLFKLRALDLGQSIELLQSSVHN